MTRTSRTPAAAPDGAGPTDSLTERYLYAATRRLPEDQRTDVADELRGSIADRRAALAEERPELDDAAAERAALVELGDPDRLAADYTGRGLYLIGPDVYPAFQRVLARVLAVVVPIVVLVVGVVDAIDEQPWGDVVFGSLWIGFATAVQIFFWVTLTFVLIERNAPGHASLRESLEVEWTPDQLPALPGRPGALSDLAASLAFSGLTLAALVWQQFGSPVSAGGERLPILDPDLWSSWLPVLVVLLLADAAFEIVKYRAGRWSIGLATVNTVLALGFGGVLVHLGLTDQLLNPAAISAIQADWSGFDPDVTHTIVALSALVIFVWDVADGWWRALRPARV